MFISAPPNSLINSVRDRPATLPPTAIPQLIDNVRRTRITVTQLLFHYPSLPLHKAGQATKPHSPRCRDGRSRQPVLLTRNDPLPNPRAQHPVPHALMPRTCKE